MPSVELTSNSNIEHAVDLIRSGALVIYPTDTVYGLGCDPFNSLAVRKLVDAKQRTKSSLPVLIDTIDRAGHLGEFNDDARRLAEAFWPGPLTIVLPSKIPLPGITSGSGLIGIRIPNHRTAMRLIVGCGGAVVGTSANLSGKKPAKSVDEIDSILKTRVDLVIDEGPTAGIESTVVRLSRKGWTILRQGQIEERQIMRALRPETM